MSNLDKAIEIAAKAHAGQQDKAGQPYILHPLRLMLRFETEEEMIVAVMHDVIEDSDLSLENLRTQGFPDEIVEAIECLTKKDGEEYGEFVLRVSKNQLAKKIKIADIKDNLNLTRLENISDKDLKRVEKYHRALKLLLSS